MYNDVAPKLTTSIDEDLDFKGSTRNAEHFRIDSFNIIIKALIIALLDSFLNIH